MSMSVLRPRLLLGGLAGLLAACSFDTAGLDRRPPCGSDADCPGGTCLAGSCWFGGDDDASPGDAGADAETGVDATPDADAGVCPLAAPECRGQIAAFCDETGTVVQVNCTDPDACSGGSCTCSEGACVPRACNPGRRICEGDDVLECDASGLANTLVETCAEGTVCIGGSCVDTACEPGVSQCFGESLAVCSPAGQFVEQTDCADQNAFCDETLETPLCVTRVCQPGVLRCLEGSEAVQQCNTRGSAWDEAVACRAGTYCDGGICTEQACDPDSVFCQGPFEVATCDPRGSDAEIELCDAGTRCAEVDGDASCVPQICVPDSAACTSDQLGTRLCDPFGAGYLVESPCPRGQFCAEGACTPQVCTPAATRCTGDFTIATCNAIGSAELVTTCDAGTYCNGALGIPACASQVCTPGQQRCQSTTRLEVCDSRGAAWTAAAACPSGDACFADACRDVVCTGTTCASTSAELRCIDAGTATESVACAAGSSCRSNQCRPWVCTPGATFCSGDEVRTCDIIGGASALITTCDIGCTDGACIEPACGDGVVSAADGEECDDGNENACDGCASCVTEWALQISGATTATAPVTAYTPGNGDVTFEAWVRPTSDAGVFFGLRTGSETDGVWLGMDAGRPYFEVDMGSAGGATRNRATGPTAITDGRWYHLAGVRRTNNVALFVNGRLAAASTVSSSFTAVDANRFYIGRDNTVGTSASGQIDEVRVSGRAVYLENFAPVRRLPNNGANTVLIYHFDGESAATAVDSGGSGRDLALAGTTLAADSCFGAALASATCGDGAAAPWEECDDSNAVGGDGCSATCHTEPACTGGIIGLNGECYQATTAGQWTAVRDACVGAGSRLVTINNWVENRWITERFSIPGSGVAWIGLNDRDTEGTYAWASGLSSTYRAWGSGEPNNMGGGQGEDCIAVAFAGGLWNDAGCNNAFRGICER